MACRLTEANLLYIGFNYDGQLGVLPRGLFKDDKDGTIYDILVKMQKELHDQSLHYDVRLAPVVFGKMLRGLSFFVALRTLIIV